MSKIFGIILGAILVAGAGFGIRFLTTPSASTNSQIIPKTTIDLVSKTPTPIPTPTPSPVVKPSPKPVATKPTASPVITPFQNELQASEPSAEPIVEPVTPTFRTVIVNYEANIFNPSTVNLKKAILLNSSINIPWRYALLRACTHFIQVTLN
jgi:hypothetical protein